MVNCEEHDDRISAYLAGKLTPDQQAAFRADLEKDSTLRQEVDELRQIRLGIEALDTMSSGHVDSRILAVYATEPEQLDEGTRQYAAAHLGLCPDCREELRICGGEVPLEQAVPSQKQRNLFLAFVKWLFAPRLALRPAYALVALVVLAVPLTYMVLQPQQDGSVLTYDVVPVGTRGELPELREVTIKSGVDFIRLQSSLPGLEDQPCSFSLHYDADQKLELSRHDDLDGNSFVLDIPTSYLRRDGGYTLLVQSLTGMGDEEAPYRFRLIVRHSK